VNSASQEQLEKLDKLTPDIAAAIIDWRDADNQVTPGGAEADYYNSLQPPYQPRNGPFQTVRELLMVKGISSELLLGKDLQANGMLESGENLDEGTQAESLVDSSDMGWAANMTVDSSVKNVNAAGEQRVNIQSADENSLAAVQRFNSAIARAIVSYRGQHQFQSLADLLDVTAQNSSSTANPSAQSANQNNSSSSSGPRVISEDLLTDVADDLTADSNQESAGLVNVNTASLEVLMCLPGVDRQLAQAIISFRQSNGFLANIAWLLKVPGMSRDIFKQVAPLVSVRSETFRILSEGKVNSSGASERIQVIVHADTQDVQMLSYREDDL
jgi:competence ComEA-like helix-hairpin-helix protein